MFCPNCGKKLPDNAQFCDACGSACGAGAPVQPSTPPVSPAPQNANVQTSQNPQRGTSNFLQKSKKKSKLVVPILAAVVLIFVYLVNASSDVSRVKDGHFYFNSSKTVGEAFEGFFGDTHWESKEINKVHYVYFRGKSKDEGNGKEMPVNVTFVVNPKTNEFEVQSLHVGKYDVTGQTVSIMNQIIDGNHNFTYYHD